MTANELFDRLAPLVAPALEEIFRRRDLCILATRVVIEAARYYGVAVSPVAVRLIAYNAPYARHVANRFEDVEDRHRPQTWGDGSWSVGVGYGAPRRLGGWDGHLIAMADGLFADCSIRQCERVQHGIYTGPALIGPYSPPVWKAANDSGTVVEYSLIEDDRWRRAPDWRDAQRRRPIVGKLIRKLTEAA